MINDAHCTIQGNECRICSVYRFGSLCTEDIKRLLHDTSNEGDQSSIMMKLLNLKHNPQKEEK